MMNIVFSDSAEQDLHELLTYYLEEAGVEVALMIENRLMNQINRLAVFPERIRQSERITGVRELVFRGLPYIAFVRIHENRQMLEVVNIVHTARKLP